MLSNYQIADHFRLLSQLMDIHGENEFRSKSYAAAAFSIEKLPVQLAETDPDKWISYKGIGESAAKKIGELIVSGELPDLKRLLEKTPAGVLEMLAIKGLGPKKIAVIWREMELESIGELLYACQENRLLHYKGFGEKSQKSIEEHILFYLQHKNIHLYRDVEDYAKGLQRLLLENFPDKQTELTGEFRRQMEIIHSLEWVTTIPLDILAEKLKAFEIEITDIQPTYLKGKGNASIELQFHFTITERFGSEWFKTSASENFLKAWGNIEAHAKEETLFINKGISYIPAFYREQELLKEVPVDLISTSSIRGIIHSHSNWSDGNNTLEEMANACIDQGLEYLVISDHSKTASYAQGLSIDRVKAQHQLVDELNTRLAPFRIFKSIESDILGDGALDYPDSVLSTFDLVIASIHSNLRMPEEKAMLRLMTAIENPYTTILGHMTGRLLLSRNGYPVDHRKIIDACVANQVVIELNAHPRRLDIDWRWIEYAMEKGAILSINPDAHDVSGYKDIRYGVLVAQKGGLTNARNLSSFNLTQMENFLETTRQKKKKYP